jgi:hypothetical protein
MRKATYLILAICLLSFSCSRKWKQPSSCDFDLTFKSDLVSPVNEINSSKFFTESIQFDGIREQAANISLSQAIDVNLNGNSSQEIHFDIPQGTYTNLSATIILSRNSGASNTIKIIGKHNHAGGGFSNFQFTTDEDVMLSASSLDSDGTNTVVLSKKVNRQAEIILNVNSLLDGLSEASWLAAAGSGSMIVVDSTTNLSMYLYLINNISNHLEIKFL